MGNLTHAVLVVALATAAGATIVSGAEVASPNDQLWFIDVDAPAASVQREADVSGGFKTAVASWNVPLLL